MSLPPLAFLLPPPEPRISSAGKLNALGLQRIMFHYIVHRHRLAKRVLFELVI